MRRLSRSLLSHPQNALLKICRRTTVLWTVLVCMDIADLSYIKLMPMSYASDFISGLFLMRRLQRSTRALLKSCLAPGDLPYRRRPFRDLLRNICQSGQHLQQDNEVGRGRARRFFSLIGKPTESHRRFPSSLRTTWARTRPPGTAGLRASPEGAHLCTIL